MLLTVGIVVSATALGIFAASASNRTPLVTEIQHSTDGGETWADVTSASSATGTVALVGDQRGEYYWVQVTATDVYGIRQSFVPSGDKPTFYNAYAATPSTDVTMTWTATGRYSAVQ